MKRTRARARARDANDGDDDAQMDPNFHGGRKFMTLARAHWALIRRRARRELPPANQADGRRKVAARRIRCKRLALARVRIGGAPAIGVATQIGRACRTRATAGQCVCSLGRTPARSSFGRLASGRLAGALVRAKPAVGRIPAQRERQARANEPRALDGND